MKDVKFALEFFFSFLHCASLIRCLTPPGWLGTDSYDCGRARAWIKCHFSGKGLRPVRWLGRQLVFDGSGGCEAVGLVLFLWSALCHACIGLATCASNISAGFPTLPSPQGARPALWCLSMSRPAMLLARVTHFFCFLLLSLSSCKRWTTHCRW